MGFRKAIYDVEEKGLDPTKPHSEVGADGRLAFTDVSPNLPTANEVERGSSAPETKKKKAVSVRKKNATTLKSNEQEKEVIAKQDSNDSDTPSDVHKELPEKTKKSKPKQTRKRKSPTKKRTKASKAASTRRKTKKEET